jgi:Predicted extracellular nuclease
MVVLLALALALTGCTSAARTELAAPADVQVSARSDAAAVSWTPPADASSAGFRVELSTDESFTAPTATTSQVPSVALGSLQPDTTYFLRVFTLGTDSAPGRPSTVVRFTTPARAFAMPAPVPELSSATSTSIDVAWKVQGDGLRYEVQLATDAAFAAATSATVADAEHRFAELSADVVYRVRVRTLSGHGQPLSPWSDPVTGSPAKELPLRVGNFNVDGASTSTWAKRRPVVISLIASQDLDVLGLQEAGYKKGKTQFAQITSGLGPQWRVTEAGRYTTSTTRLAYNSERVRLVRNGHVRLTRDSAFGNRRFIVWAEFEQLSTGKHFLYLTSHLIYQRGGKANSARTAQAKQIIALARTLGSATLPTIVSADFNTHAKRTSGNGVYRAFLDSGYADPLARTGELGTAEQRVRANLEPYNGSNRKANMSYSTTLIDHIFITPMRVEEWETVARLDNANRFVGTIPSDHAMLRATVYLP